MFKQRIQHKLTAYHLRDRFSSKPSKLAICSCGWRCSRMRKDRRARIMRATVKGCYLRGHSFGPSYGVDDGPAGGKDSEFREIAAFRQCERCYLCR